MKSRVYLFLSTSERKRGYYKLLRRGQFRKWILFPYPEQLNIEPSEHEHLNKSVNMNI